MYSSTTILHTAPCTTYCLKQEVQNTYTYVHTHEYALSTHWLETGVEDIVTWLNRFQFLVLNVNSQLLI